MCHRRQNSAVDVDRYGVSKFSRSRNPITRAAPIAIDGPTEIADAAAAFNRMQARLNRYVDDRATVVGASQYTVQLSGSTIYVSPLDTLPVRNVPVIAPTLPLGGETIDSAAVSRAIQTMLRRLDLHHGEQPVGIFAPWAGSATFQRLDAFCKGVVDGLAPVLAQGHPVILAGEGDVGGLIGIHLREEMKIGNPIISIDGLELKEFDYIDIGAMLESSGAVPVVIKSLIFPGHAAPESEKKSVARIDA